MKMKIRHILHTRCVIAGGLFHGDDGITQLAFKNTVEKMNARSGFYQLTPIVFIIPRTDTYKAQKIGKQFQAYFIKKMIARLFL